jgi:predicted transcriptional regulator of viral defense system
MKIEKALYNWYLNDYPLRIITKEYLFFQFLLLWKQGSYKGKSLSNISYRHNFNHSFEKVEEYFRKDKNLLVQDKLHGKYSHVTKTNQKLTPEEAICSIYPFGYFNYLTALQRYGFTEIQSKKLYFSIISRSDWNIFFQNLLSKIDYSYLPQRYDLDLRKLKPTYPQESHFNYKKLILIQQKNIDLYNNINNLRINSIGSLFIDITRRPELSGGFDTVKECYKNFSQKYLNEIYMAIEIKGTSIDKARIGYLLDKFVGINDSTIRKWKRDMVGLRGSSRKLIASEPFAPTFDPEWNISLNI